MTHESDSSSKNNTKFYILRGGCKDSVSFALYKNFSLFSTAIMVGRRGTDWLSGLMEREENSFEECMVESDDEQFIVDQ